MTPAALEPFRDVGLHQAMYIVRILTLVLTAYMFIASRMVPRYFQNMQHWMRESTASRPPRASLPRLLKPSGRAYQGDRNACST